MNIRLKIINLARTYIGVPFVHKGRSHKGVDCIGLLYVAFQPFFNVMDPQDYGPVVTSCKSFMEIKDYADRIKANEAGPGDIVLMNIAGASAHYGLIIGDTVIHADQSVGKVIEHRLADKRIVAYFRLKEMTPWVKLGV
jgi:cell wall-associated NlpC family hydrolase